MRRSAYALLPERAPPSTSVTGGNAAASVKSGAAPLRGTVSERSKRPPPAEDGLGTDMSFPRGKVPGIREVSWLGVADRAPPSRAKLAPVAEADLVSPLTVAGAAPDWRGHAPRHRTSLSECGRTIAWRPR